MNSLLTTLGLVPQKQKSGKGIRICGLFERWTQKLKKRSERTDMGKGQNQDYIKSVLLLWPTEVEALQRDFEVLWCLVLIITLQRIG